MDVYNQKEAVSHPKLDPTLAAASDSNAGPLVKDATEKGEDYYDNLHVIPIPPPPPSRNARKTYLNNRYFSGFCAFLIGCMIGATILYIIRPLLPPVNAHPNTMAARQQNIPSTATVLSQEKSTAISSTPTAPVTMMAPTPTLDAVQATQSPDFDTYIKGFAEAMSAKQYDTISKATDTNNFQALALYTDGGSGNWKDTHDQLVSGSLGFLIQYPVITAAQKGYTCNNNYNSQGLPPWIVIHNARTMYIVGTTQEPNTPGTLQTEPNATVFIFEQSNTGYMSGRNPWYWRGYVMNNTAGCGNSPN
ncbi:hypothetical protein KDH_67570 [Dictyobacter sp. S3.2.2.5]|uniref:Uncharacterized protein n=1 Tax=Dictyobacter halimunensis TaxID=3026934 RepID=A0ABQ6G586_9CHLR|nr:hypothetical protein KDH_67570 [Dictyobacter sp. S3.2.2.5]